jgi:hypothetical protein
MPEPYAFRSGGNGNDTVKMRRQREIELDVCLTQSSRRVLRARDAAQRLTQARSEPCIRLRQAPDRGALQHDQPLDFGRDRRDDLDGGGAGADDRHLPAAQVLLVVPARGVYHRPFERLEPRDVGWLRLSENAGRADQEPCGESRPPGDRQAPKVMLIIERGGGDLRVQANPLAQTVSIDAVLGVGLELSARRIDA